MKKVLLISMILTGTLAFTMAHAAPAAPSSVHGPFINVDDANPATGNAPQAAQQGQPTDDDQSLAQATAPNDQSADNSDYSDNDDMANNTDADSIDSSDSDTN